MNILFPADSPAYRDENLTVVFAAVVDGERVPCAISVEARIILAWRAATAPAGYVHSMLRARGSKQWRESICISIRVSPCY
jgi:hypothetical protein